MFDMSQNCFSLCLADVIIGNVEMNACKLIKFNESNLFVTQIFLASCFSINHPDRTKKLKRCKKEHESLTFRLVCQCSSYTSSMRRMIHRLYSPNEENRKEQKRRT